MKSTITIAVLGMFSLLAASAVQGQTLTVTLTASDHNGYNISCFGLKDGSIDATVTGGTPPYTYDWSNRATTEDLTGVPAGYYKIVVMDANSAVTSADITLVEPTAMKVAAEPYKYPSGYNISCHDCFNGSIDVTVYHGVPPYSYLWNDGAQTEDRSGLGALKYAVRVTDANGCVTKSETVYMNQPDRDTWNMGGNASTNPAVQYVGTSDSTDLVFRSKGEEVLRLMPDGSIKIFGTVANEGPLYRDADGTLRLGGPAGPFPPFPSTLCALGLGPGPYWEIGGNTFTLPLCPEADAIPRIGTKQPFPLHFITNDHTRMVITEDGKVGIGTEPPGGAVDEYRLFVEDGIVTRDVLVKLGEWPDYVFSDGYRMLTLEELHAYLLEHRHLPGIPSAKELAAKGGVALGDMQRDLVRTVEEQALYILQLKEEVDELKSLVMELLNNR